MAEGHMAVVIRPIVNSPELSKRIGYLVSQQRRAYNAAIEWLNREPGLALRVSAARGATLDRSLCGRITRLRQSDPSWGAANTPRRLHDAGARQAHLAQQFFASNRLARLNEIRRIEDIRHHWAVNPPHTLAQWRALRRDESRSARLATRQHRRSLSYRTRKKGTQTLEVDNNQGFLVTPDRMSIWLTGVKGGLRVPLRRPLPGNVDVRSFRLVEKRKGRMGVLNRKLTSVEYEAHVDVLHKDVVPMVAPEVMLDVVAVRIRKHWATSDGAIYRNDGPHACVCPPPKPRGDGRPGRFRHSGRCRFARPQRLQERIVAKSGGSARRRASNRRRKLERRRRELLRIRIADRNRVFTGHAQDLLDKRHHAVRTIAVEHLSRTAMMASAKGGAKAPGQGVLQKSIFNRTMAEAASGETEAILMREAAKRGIPVVQVNPKDTNRTCSKCGTVDEESRKNQARFECVACGWTGHADANACGVLAFRAYQQQVDPAAVLGPPLLGGQEQSSSPH